MKQLAFVILLIIVSKNLLSAQSVDLGSWNILNIKYNHSQELSLFGEGQIRSLRFYNHFHYYEVKGGIEYKIHPSVKLSLGAGSYQTYKERGNFELPKNNDEFRLWPQIFLLQEIVDLKIEQRYRTELRWTSSGYRSRFRYRFGISSPFGNESNGYRLFQASMSNELFFTDNEPYYERNRFQVALNYRSSRCLTIQLGYLHQFDYKINDETGRDFFVLGFYYEVFGNASPDTEQEGEPKDN